MGSHQTSNWDVNLRAYIVMRNRVERDTVPHRFAHGSTVLFPESLFGKQRDDTLYWFSNSFSLWSMILRLGECAWTNFGTRRGQKDLILSLWLWEWELTKMLLYLDFMFFSSSSASLVKNCTARIMYSPIRTVPRHILAQGKVRSEAQRFCILRYFLHFVLNLHWQQTC